MIKNRSELQHELDDAAELLEKAFDRLGLRARFLGRYGVGIRVDLSADAALYLAGWIEGKLDAERLGESLGTAEPQDPPTREKES